MKARAPIKTYGHQRRSSLPVDGGKPKVCGKCKLWFSAQPYERTCHGCLSPGKRARRYATHSATPEDVKLGKNSQVKPPLGRALCDELAMELAKQMYYAELEAIDRAWAKVYLKNLHERHPEWPLVVREL